MIVKWYQPQLMIKVDRAMRSIERAGAKAIAADAKSNIHSMTGNLANGIKVLKSKFPNGGWIAISTAPHSHLVELGHEVKPRGKGKNKNAKSHGHKLEAYSPPGKSSGGRVKAYPFMKPAKEKNDAQIMRDFRRIFK